MRNRFEVITQYLSDREGVFKRSPLYSPQAGLQIESYVDVGLDPTLDGTVVDKFAIEFRGIENPRLRLWLGFSQGDALELQLYDIEGEGPRAHNLSRWARTDIAVGDVSAWQTNTPGTSRLECSKTNDTHLDCQLNGVHATLYNPSGKLFPLCFRAEDGVIMLDSFDYSGPAGEKTVRFLADWRMMANLAIQSIFISLIVISLLGLLISLISRSLHFPDYPLTKIYREISFSSIVLVLCPAAFFFKDFSRVIISSITPIIILLCIAAVVTLLLRVHRQVKQIHKEKPEAEVLHPIEISRKRLKYYLGTLVLLFVIGLIVRADHDYPDMVTISSKHDLKPSIEVGFGETITLRETLFSNPQNSINSFPDWNGRPYGIFIADLNLNPETLLIFEFVPSGEPKANSLIRLEIPSVKESYIRFGIDMPWRGAPISAPLEPIVDMTFEPLKTYQLTVMMTKKGLCAYIDGLIIAEMPITTSEDDYLIKARVLPGRARIQTYRLNGLQLSFTEDSYSSTNKFKLFLLFIICLIFPFFFKKFLGFTRLSNGNAKLVFKFFTIAVWVFFLLCSLYVRMGFLDQNFRLTGLLLIFPATSVTIALLLFGRSNAGLFRKIISAAIVGYLGFVLYELGAQSQSLTDQYLDLRSSPWYWTSSETGPNRWRFNYEAIPAARKQERLLLGLGGSSTQGMGLIADEKNYLSRLNDNLAAESRMNILNLAKYSTVSYDGYAMFRAVLNELPVKAAVVSYVYNDSMIIPIWPNYKFEEKGQGLFATVSSRASIRNDIIARQQRIGDTDSLDVSFKLYNETMRQYSALASERGVFLIFLIEPVVDNYKKGSKSYKVYADGLRELAHRKIAHIVEFDDLFPALNGESVFFFDQVHPTPAGHSMIAKRLAQAMTYWDAPAFEKPGASYIYPVPATFAAEEQNE